MSGFNQVILVGNLGIDPEVRVFPSGDKVVKFTLATSWGSGEKKITDWHRVAVFGQSGDFAERYLKKGDRALVRGRVTYDQYEKDGVNFTATEIRANEVMALGGGNRDEDAPRNEPKPSPVYDDEDLPF